MGAPIGNQNALGNEGGAPTKYKEEYAEQAYKLCLLGATDAKLADFFEVDLSTISNWKNQHIEFLESLKRGKYAADAEIADALYNRAKGMTIIEQQAIKLTTKAQGVDKDGNPTRAFGQTERIEIVELSREIPPDTTSIIFWLKNRQPKEWRDKVEIETHDTTFATPEERLKRLQLLQEKMKEVINNENL